MSIKGKTALVTGSASGIGKCIAQLFAQEGAKLLICDVDANALAETEKELKGMGATVESEVYNAGEIADIDRVFKKLASTYGDLDILVNNTGIAGPTKPIVEITPAEWDQTLEINLRGAFYCIKLAAPYMIQKKSGKIVNMSSQSGKKSLPNRSPYDASKMGIIGLTRCAADELGEYNINVNAICPGAVEGPRLERVFEGQSKSRGITVEEARGEFTKPAFLKRTVPPQDIAQMVLFLCDDEKSRSVTGQDINVNCGTITY